MWTDAVDMLVRAERLHRQLFEPSRGQALGPAWEPPVDVLETGSEVVIVAALPGISDEALILALDGPFRVSAGERAVPADLRAAIVHRLELPRGRFERRVPLPAGRYDQIRHRTEAGCLVIRLRKLV